jgi:hypothetical protein
MADPKFAPAITIHQSDLPATCMLNNPPAGVAISLAQIFDSTGTVTNLGISASGQSFVIPSTIATGSATLEVAVTGGADDPAAWAPVDVVENATPPILVGTIFAQKFVTASVAVLP